MVVGRLSAVVLAILAAFVVSLFTWEKAQSKSYQQVVDDSDKARFEASKGWKRSDSGEEINGKGYRFGLPSKKAATAKFKVKIPSDGEYAVYARWPEVPGLNDEARVGIETAYGTRWTEVDQTRDGGRWVRVGEYEMPEGDDYSVKISRDSDGEGNVVADAVKVVRMSSYEAEEGDDTRTHSAEADGPSRGFRSEAPTTSAAGAQIVREARKYVGTPYGPQAGGLDECRPYTRMDCTCLTRTVFERFGTTLPDDPQALWDSYGRRVSTARPGDIVFFSEDYSGRITHAGIYSGDGKLVHASSYFGEVRESEMRYLRGYVGAKRMPTG